MKKLISLLICVTLLLGALVTFTSAQSERTVFYLDKGDVVIGDTSVSGYDINGKNITESNENGYTVTQTSSSVRVSNSLTVSNGVQDVELKDLNIYRSGNFDYAVCVLDGAGAVFTLIGTSHIEAGPYRAAVDVAQTADVTIQGDGVLYATSMYEAGIGGGNAKRNGKLTINSGTIYATGGVEGYSAGIGGGTSGSGGTIIINGGNITAVGGANAAGIGGGNISSGGSITINGGTITAQGGSDGAGIGGGFMGSGGTIVINSGSVKAIAGTNASVIGNGTNCKTAFAGVHNSDNKVVSLVKVEMPAFDELYLNTTGSSSIKSLHKDDKYLYLYLPAGKSIAITKNDGKDAFFEINAQDSTVKQIYPFIEGNYTIQNNSIICFDINDVKTSAGFTLDVDMNALECELVYNEKVISRYQLSINGDVNSDGKINSTDALLVLQIVTEKIVPTEYQKKSADYNSDGKINSYDALLILRKSVGII